MNFRKYIYGIIAILMVLFGLLIYKAENVVPSTMKFADFGLGVDSLYFYESNIYYKNQELIQKYFDLNKNKSVTRVSFDKARTATRILRFAYNSDKGRDSFIDDKGRICFVVSKSEIRNKSILHWLWWKLDFDPYTSMYYVTDQDPKVVELANQIKNDLSRSQYNRSLIQLQHKHNVFGELLFK